MAVKIRHRGNFKNTTQFFTRATSKSFIAAMHRYGKQGVQALASATPRDSGLTAESWDYQIETSRGATRIQWTNSNVNNGVSIAVLLQYGRGTRGGGFVIGRDYINPAIRPIFDGLAEEAWREVTG